MQTRVSFSNAQPRGAHADKWVLQGLLCVRLRFALSVPTACLFQGARNGRAGAEGTRGRVAAAA